MDRQQINQNTQNEVTGKKTCLSVSKSHNGNSQITIKGTNSLKLSKSSLVKKIIWAISTAPLPPRKKTKTKYHKQT